MEGRKGKGKPHGQSLEADGKDKAQEGKGDEAQKPQKPEQKPEQKPDRTDIILQNNKKLRDSLAELTPDVIWRSRVRGNELDRRIAKASTCERELDKIQANAKASARQKADASDLSEAVKVLAEEASSLKLTCQAIRNPDAKLLAAELSNPHGDLATNLAKCAHKLLADHHTVIDAIHVIAKKMMEARLCLWLLFFSYDSD